MERKHPPELLPGGRGSSGKETASASPATRSGHGGDANGAESDRRKKTSELYGALRTLLPNLFPRATRARIIEEAVAYIKELEGTVAALEARKAAAAAAAATATSVPRTEQTPAASRTWSGGGRVEVAVSGGAVFFGITLPARPGVLTRVLDVFHRHDATVFAATLACGGEGRAVVTVTAAVARPETVDSIKAEILSI